MQGRERVQMFMPPTQVAPGKRQPLVLADVYQRYSAYVAAIASRILGRETEVEEVVQDVFAAAVSGLRTMEDVRQVKGWLAKVTVRTAIRQLRKRKLREVLHAFEPANYDCLADSRGGPEERHLIAEVYRALDSVPPRQRVPWTLRYVEGETVERVAELCECSPATAKRRIAKAHHLIQRQMRGHNARQT